MSSSVTERNTKRSPSSPSNRREVDRLADDDADATHLRAAACRSASPSRCRSSRPGSPARRPRAPCARRPCDRGRAGRRGCGCPRGRCRGCRRRPAPAGPCLERRLGGLAARAVDGQLARRLEEHARRPALQALAVKYSLLARKTTGRSTMSGRKIESMNERWFDASTTAPSFGHVLEADDPRPEDREEDRTDHDVLHDPVEHRRASPPRRTNDSA